MQALIVVDLQNDFMPGGALAVPEGDRVVPIANAMTRAFDLVIATQDWHPPNHGSFVTEHPGHAVGDRVELGGVPQVLWPPHCVQGTPGAAFHSELDTSRFARVFHKGTRPDVDSYSTFWDNARRRSTGLGEFLAEERVDTIYLMGLATDYCVRWSALDARRIGLATRIVLDGCRGIELVPGDIDRAIAEMRQAGVEIVDSRRILG